MPERLSETTTNCPVVRVEDGPWMRYVDLSGGAYRMGVVTFDARVEWVRETSSGVVTRYANGAADDDEQSDSHSDWYGYGTSAFEVVDLARARARKLGAGTGMPVSVEAFTLVRDHPLLPRPERATPIPGARREYDVPPKGWLRPDDAWLRDRLAFDAAPTGPFMESENRPADLGDVPVARLTLWSSSNPEGSPKAAALLDAALATLADGIPVEVAGRLRENWAGWVAQRCSREG